MRIALFTISNLVISDAFPADLQSLAGGVFSEIGQFGNSVGLAVIFSATVLNLCLHKLEPKHLYALPSFVVEPYERAGSMGVTLVFAAIGLFRVLPHLHDLVMATVHT